MPEYLKEVYDTLGPCNLPMKDKQALQLDAMLKHLPKDDPAYEPTHLVVEKATSELLPGERADVSWISTEDPDRHRDIVLASGMDDSHFRINPIVTLQHAYWMPPVGRSLWRKKVKDGQLSGIKAKTQYPTAPDSWPEGSDWPPDCAFTLVQSGLLNGKSIGILPLEVSYPSDEEKEKDPRLKKVYRIIKKWLLLEYACVYIPAQQNAVVEAVSKGLIIPKTLQEAMGLELKEVPAPTPSPGQPNSPVISYTPWSEIEKHIQERVNSLDFHAISRKVLQEGYHRLTGKV